MTVDISGDPEKDGQSQYSTIKLPWRYSSGCRSSGLLVVVVGFGSVGMHASGYLVRLRSSSVFCTLPPALFPFSCEFPAILNLKP